MIKIDCFLKQRITTNELSVLGSGVGITAYDNDVLNRK